MLRTITSRIAVTSFLTLAGFLSLNAQAQAPITTKLIFSLTGAVSSSTTGSMDTYTVSQATLPVLPVKVVVSDPTGITSASISSKVGSGSVRLGGATTGTLGVTFFDSYYAANKSYVFTASATNAQGVTTSKQIMVNLTP